MGSSCIMNVVRTFTIGVVFEVLVVKSITSLCVVRWWPRVLLVPVHVWLNSTRGDGWRIVSWSRWRPERCGMSWWLSWRGRGRERRRGMWWHSPTTYLLLEHNHRDHLVRSRAAGGKGEGVEGYKGGGAGHGQRKGRWKTTGRDEMVGGIELVQCVGPW